MGIYRGNGDSVAIRLFCTGQNQSLFFGDDDDDEGTCNNPFDNGNKSQLLLLFINTLLAQL